MSDSLWGKIVRVGIAALLFLFIIIVGGDTLISFLGSGGDITIGEAIGNAILGFLNWIGDVLNYAIFGE